MSWTDSRKGIIVVWFFLPCSFLTLRHLESPTLLKTSGGGGGTNPHLNVLRRKRTDVTFGANWEASFATLKIHAPQVTSRKSPGVDLSRCEDHVVFRVDRIAGSRLRKVVRNFVPEKAYMRKDSLYMNRVPIRKLLKKVKNTPPGAVADRWPIR
ncbi:hypothetical protein TNCV_857301 [Trichonephila clavipes]|nr:hypothetical protein TNCV_857301 [Trichonephila clavipes]